jgi:hypothetical protein
MAGPAGLLRLRIRDCYAIPLGGEMCFDFGGSRANCSFQFWRQYTGRRDFQLSVDYD